MSYKISAYERSNRSGFQVEINTKLPDGRPYRERKKLTLGRADCERWAKKREAELMLNGLGFLIKEVSNDNGMTFTEFGEQYLKERAQAGAEAKQSYQRVMRSMFDVHLSPRLGPMDLREIDFEKVEKLKLALKVSKKNGKMRGDKAINNVLTLLGTMLRNALDKKLIATLPKIVLLQKEKKAKSNKTVKADGVHCYTAQQVSSLVGAAQRIDEHAHLVALIGCDAGLRLGELMALKWADVDLVQGVLNVNRSIWRYEGKIWEDVPKSGAAREIPMTPAVRRALEESKRRRAGYVLGDAAGAPVTERKLRVMLRAAQREAGLVMTGRLHVLRHSFCSVLASRGAPVRYIQQLAGHANITTTERYLHSDTEGEREAIALLDRKDAA